MGFSLFRFQKGAQMSDAKARQYTFKLVILEDDSFRNGYSFRDHVLSVLDASGIAHSRRMDGRIFANRYSRYDSTRGSFMLVVTTNSLKEGRDLRRALREDPDIWLDERPGWYYHKSFVFVCYPHGEKPVEKKRDDELYKLLLKTAEEADICKNVAKIAHNKILENGLSYTWRETDPFELLGISGLGPQTVRLILLARGDDPEVIAKEDHKDPDIPCAMEEVLSWEDGRYEEFSRLRGEVIKGSHHPELMDILVDFAFDMGCEWAARTGKEKE